MSRHIKSAVVCEVCKDPVRHGQAPLVVGRKSSGTPRVVHDRSRCRRRWEAEKDRLMARWPENRAGVPLPAVAAVVEKVPEVFRVPRPDVAAPVVVTVKAEDLGGVVPVQVEAAQPAAKEGTVEPSKRHRWRFKTAMDAAILDYFSRSPWRVGSAGKLYAVLEHSQPDLLVDGTGKAVTEPVFSNRVTQVLRDKAAKEAGKAEAQKAPTPGPTWPDLSKALALGETLVAGVLALVRANDTATLEVLRDLMEAKS